MNRNRKKMTIGIIGGSGLNNPQILENIRRKEVKTKFGKPADKLTIGKLNGCKVVILARHGRKHTVAPTQVPFRANIWALKQEGCEAILATTACGSLTEKMKPGDLVFIDQFIDFTKHRNLTFFENKVVHTSMAEPFDKELRQRLIKIASKLKFKYHTKGTMITIEGPRFSTKAESFMFRKLGADLINMSTVPEVILANELGIPYQSIAMVTDYDCWKENEETVSFELVLKRMEENAEKVKNILVRFIKSL